MLTLYFAFFFLFLVRFIEVVFSIGLSSLGLVVVLVAVRTALQFADNFGGISALITVFNLYLSCICIIIY